MKPHIPYAIIPFLTMLLMAGMSMTGCEQQGENIEKTVSLPDFDTLRVEGPVDITLVMDTANSMTLSGDPVIVGGVRYTVKNGILTLRSEYPYKMFKPSSNKPGIRLSVSSLHRIDVAVSCGIRTAGKLTGDEIGLIVMSKYADVSLNLGCTTFYYYDYSLSGGMIRLTGQATNLKIWNFSLMDVDASALDAGFVFCENNARSPCYVRASQELDYSIRGQGDIYYFGDPPVIRMGSRTSTGRLIRAD